MYETITTGDGWGEALALLETYLEHDVVYGPVQSQDS